MKTIAKKLTFCALLGLSAGAHAAPVLIPNGDFSTPGGADFGFFQSASGVVSFPATEGNPGGYGLVNNTLGSWGGGLVSPPDNAFPANQGIPLANLGLVAGNTYTFSMDMKNFAGTGKGGLKLEAWNGGAGAASNTGDMPATGSSNNWATYSWNYSIPAGTTSIKIVPLLTGASGGSNADSVGFDNIKVNNTPVPPPPFVPDTIINGDFEIPGGSGWNPFAPGGPTITFPNTEGNPSGHAVIDATAADGFAAIEAFGGAEKTFASLGLAPGDSFTIQLDMRILEGSNIGGVQLVGPAGFTAPAPGLERPTIIGDGSTWETYSIPITVPVSPAQARFTFLWGFGSKVAFDNIKIVLPAPAGPLQANIATGVAVSWTAASAVNRYQPQESSNGTAWTNLGPAIIGNIANSIFDDSKSPFYQVLESAPVVQEAAYNVNFTEEGFDEAEAEGWEPAQSQWPTRLATGGRNDNGACMQLQVVNALADPADPNGSEIQQNTRSIENHPNGVIIPGNTYNFSFWAKQISSGPSYVQEYRVNFLAESGAELPPGGATWTGFSGTVGGGWELKTKSGLVAPAGAVTALIQIVCKTGAVAGGFGEVLIDDVSLLSAGFAAPNVPALAATATPTVEISWLSKTGRNYQVGSSPDLSGWSNLGGVISGDGSIKAVYDAMVDPKKFYRVGELP